MGERKYLVTREELEEAETVAIPFSQKGAANGVATLNASEELTASQVPVSVVNGSTVGAGYNGLTWNTTAKQWEEALLELTPLVAGPTVYVSKTGSDANTGATPNAAFLTIHKAIEHLEALSGGTGSIRVGVGEFIEQKLVRPSGCSVFGEGPSLTKIVLKEAENSNLLQDKKWGVAGEVGEGGTIADIKLSGNRANQTSTFAESYTVSNGVKVKVGSGTTITVLNEPTFGYSTTAFAAEGYAWIGALLVKYKGVTATEFKEVEAIYGEFEVLSEMRIRPFASVGHPLAIQSRRCSIRNVVCEEGTDSGLMIQGSGTNTNEAYPYQCVIEHLETNKNSGWGMEILSAPDGICSNWIGQINWKGGILAGGVDWRWRGGHPATGNANQELWSRASIRITAHKQSFDVWFLDTFPHAGVLIDTAAHNQALDGISFQGECFTGSCQISNGSPAIQLYGHNGNPVQKLLIDIQAGNGPERGDSTRLNRAIAPYPITELVGEQNLKTISEASGKVQVLSTLQLGPTTAMSGALQCTGGPLTYTGRTMAMAVTVLTGIAKEATSIVAGTPYGKSLAEEGFAASGIIAINTQSSSEGAVKALRVKYGKLVGNEFKEVTGNTEALPGLCGITQAFITGVTGGTANNVADGTEMTQTQRGPSSVSGRSRILATANLAPTVVPSTTGGFRIEGLYNGYPNPYLGMATIAESATEVEFTHHLGTEPRFVLIACGAAYTYTKSATAIKVKLAAGAPAGGTPVTVQAFATEA